MFSPGLHLLFRKPGFLFFYHSVLEFPKTSKFGATLKRHKVTYLPTPVVVSSTVLLFPSLFKIKLLKMNVPGNLKYSEDHEWIRVEDGNIAFIGITDHAQSELGEIVYVEVETVDDDLSAGDIFGTVEAVKTTSDLYMPVSGKILEFNTALDVNDGDNPGLVNESPYKDGWIIKIEMSDSSELEELLDAGAYTNLIGG